MGGSKGSVEVRVRLLCGARGSSKSGSAGALCEKWSSEKSIVTNCSALFYFSTGFMMLSVRVLACRGCCKGGKCVLSRVGSVC